jgi:hypothetical protein
VYEMVPPYIYIGPGDDYVDAPDLERDLWPGHMAWCLEWGFRQPYSGNLSFCPHEGPKRKAVQLHLRQALTDPWFAPIFALIPPIDRVEMDQLRDGQGNASGRG